MNKLDQQTQNHVEHCKTITNNKKNSNNTLMVGIDGKITTQQHTIAEKLDNYCFCC
jgi:hypothetical protein